MNTEPLHVIYVSQLAPGQDCAVFSVISRSARARNLERGIAGVLLFDGERFLQWLHGAHDAVSQLMDAIVADARHTDVRVLLRMPLPTVAAHPPLWRAGFIDAEVLDVFTESDPADGSAMLDGLARLVALADLDPVPNLPAAPHRPGAA